MSTLTRADVITSIATHYIDGAFVESDGRRVMDVIRPTDGHVIGRVSVGREYRRYGIEPFLETKAILES